MAEPRPLAAARVVRAARGRAGAARVAGRRGPQRARDRRRLAEGRRVRTVARRGRHAPPRHLLAASHTGRRTSRLSRGVPAMNLPRPVTPTRMLWTVLRQGRPPGRGASLHGVAGRDTRSRANARITGRSTMHHRALLGLLLAALLSAPAARAADEIHWTMLSGTSVAMDWRGTGSTVRYGTSSAYGLTATGVAPTPLPFSSSGPFREVMITGLSPGVTYHYSVDGGPDHTFHTLPAQGTSFTVYVEGDIGDTSSYPRVATEQKMIAQAAPSFVIMVGDLTYGNAHGQAAVDNHFNNVMKWSQDAAYMPGWGNHEWDSSTDDFRNYKGRFAFPNPQTSPGAPTTGGPGEDWYWFDAGNVRFIAYPEPFTGAWADWNTKVKPIMDAAQADPAIKFIVTFGHRPAYSSGHHPGDGTLKSIIDGLGASHNKYVLNLNGHSHDFERTKPQSGVVHITVGTGGGAFEQDGSCLWLTCIQ